MTTCPDCAEDVKWVCSNLTCEPCRKVVENGDLILEYLWSFMGIEIPAKLGSFLWKLGWFLNPGWKINSLYYKIFHKFPNMKIFHLLNHIGIHPGNYLMELERCPNCGYTDSFDFWEVRSIDEALANEPIGA